MSGNRNSVLYMADYLSRQEMDRRPASGQEGGPVPEDPASLEGLPLHLSGGVPVPPRPALARRIQLALKRGADIVLGLAALAALAPLLVFVALAVRLSGPGPVLFIQQREGLNGKPFAIWKFRTMHAGRCDPSGVDQTVPDDPRVTALGRFLRRTSIDELPQLFNVVKGDMSLVGPRPHPIGMRAGGVPYAELVPFYALRHAMRPGLSGWAQVSGLRGPTIEPAAARARIAHDIAYVQNFSLWLDIRIIARTLARELWSGSGS